MTNDHETATHLEHDYTQATLSPADRAMLDYAAKLTHTPWDMRRDDVDLLRSHGFDDRAILDMAQVTAYYAYANRIADGLGISLEDYWTSDYYEQQHMTHFLPDADDEKTD